MKNKRHSALSLLLVSAASMSGCGGAPPPPPPITYTIGGHISGLQGTGLVLLNNGGGTFASPVTYAVGNNPSGVVAVDLSHAGFPDLVVTNKGDSTVSVLHNTDISGYVGAVAGGVAYLLLGRR